MEWLRQASWKEKHSSVKSEDGLFLYICLSNLYKCSNSWLQSDFLSIFLIPLHLDLPITFISSHNSFESYTWRAEIVLLELLSHLEHTSKFLSCNLSCAITIHGHFLINAARGVVVSYLMQSGWLLYTSFFILLVFHAKSAFLHFWCFNFMRLIN